MQKQILKTLFVISFLLVGVSGMVKKLNAAPSITKVSGATNAGAYVQITGNNLGINTAVGTNNLQWLGGNIEAGTTDSSFSGAGWESHAEGGGFNEPKYDDGQFHSGAKSLRCDIPSEKWGCYYLHNHGTPITSIYATWWTRVHTISAYEYGQWKMFRLSPSESPTDSNSAIMFFNWFADAGSDGMKIPMLVIDSSLSPRWGSLPPAGENERIWLSKEEFPMLDEWVRMEIYAVQSSVDQTDGTFVYRIIRDDGSTIRNPINYVGNLKTRTVGSAPWQYFISPHYLGDGAKGQYWTDDMFLQFGSQARIEIGDASTWNTCTHREVQVPTTWSTNSITAIINQGSFSNDDTVYLYVVDENGEVNANGYPIVLSGEGDTTTPNAPSGLAVL